MPGPDKPIQSARGLVPSIQTYSAIYSEYSIAFVVNDRLGDDLSRVIERGLRTKNQQKKKKKVYLCNDKCQDGEGVCNVSILGVL